VAEGIPASSRRRLRRQARPAARRLSLKAARLSGPAGPCGSVDSTGRAPNRGRQDTCSPPRPPPRSVGQRTRTRTSFGASSAHGRFRPREANGWRSPDPPTSPRSPAAGSWHRRGTENPGDRFHQVDPDADLRRTGGDPLGQLQSDRVLKGSVRPPQALRLGAHGVESGDEAGRTGHGYPWRWTSGSPPTRVPPRGGRSSDRHRAQTSSPGSMVRSARWVGRSRGRSRPLFGDTTSCVVIGLQRSLRDWPARSRRGGLGRTAAAPSPGAHADADVRGTSPRHVSSFREARAPRAEHGGRLLRLSRVDVRIDGEREDQRVILIPRFRSSIGRRPANALPAGGLPFSPLPRDRPRAGRRRDGPEKRRQYRNPPARPEAALTAAQ